MSKERSHRIVHEDSAIPDSKSARSKHVDWKKRLITAGIAIPTLCLMICLPWPAFSFTVAVGTGLGYYEFRRLAEIHGKRITITMHVIMVFLLTSLRPVTLVIAPFLIGILPILAGGPTKGFGAEMLNIF